MDSLQEKHWGKETSCRKGDDHSLQFSGKSAVVEGWGVDTSRSPPTMQTWEELHTEGLKSHLSLGCQRPRQGAFPWPDPLPQQLEETQQFGCSSLLDENLKRRSQLRCLLFSPPGNSLEPWGGRGCGRLRVELSESIHGN